jgi:hypothetical protein
MGKMCCNHGHHHDHDHNEEGKSWLYKNTGSLLYAGLILGLLAKDLINTYYQTPKQQTPITQDSDLTDKLNHTH